MYVECFRSTLFDNLKIQNKNFSDIGRSMYLWLLSLFAFSLNKYGYFAKKLNKGIFALLKQTHFYK